jgi:hypothetical protein
MMTLPFKFQWTECRTVIIHLILAAFVFGLSGCSLFHRAPKTLGEVSSGYTYIPLDPFAVNTSTNCESFVTNLFNALPDNAVRISVEKFDGNGNVTYGPAGVSTKGGRYRTTVDYINADTTTIRLFIARSVMVFPKRYLSTRYFFSPDQFYRLVSLERQWLDPHASLPKNCIPETETFWVRRVSTTNDTDEVFRSELLQQYASDYELPSYGEGPPERISDEERDALDRRASQRKLSVSKAGGQFNVPVYIGIGLRVSADIRTYESGINISGLGTIGASAELKQLTGSLTVQTLGVNGKSISAALPIQSELNQTTAQNAIVAVGAIKALLYEQGTVLAPRVVGLYLPFAGGKSLVNAIISELAKQPVEWKPTTALTEGQKKVAASMDDKKDIGDAH